MNQKSTETAGQRSAEIEQAEADRILAEFNFGHPLFSEDEASITVHAGSSEERDRLIWSHRQRMVDFMLTEGGLETLPRFVMAGHRPGSLSPDERRAAEYYIDAHEERGIAPTGIQKELKEVRWALATKLRGRPSAEA